MTKQIKIIVDKIDKADDKKYVTEIIDSILEALYDFPNTVTQINLHRDDEVFYTTFKLKVSKLGDMIFVLMTEFLSCIVQTEPKVDVTIDAVEDDGNGITYRLYSFKANT